MIPKTLHFTYISEDLPTPYRNNLDHWKKTYPDWEIQFHSDEAVHRFFQRYFPNYFLDLPKISHGVILADIFRYAVLYTQGGMYTDIDTTPLKKIPDEWLSYECILGYEYQPSKFPEMFRLPYRDEEILCQWTLLSTPKHPLFKEALDQAFEKLRQKKFRIENAGDILKSTGPLHLTAVGKKYLDRSSLLILDADFFGCNRSHHLELTERSLIDHQSDGGQGWLLEVTLPHVNLST